MTPKLCLLNTQRDFQNQLILKQLIRSVIALLTSDHLFRLFNPIFRYYDLDQNSREMWHGELIKPEITIHIRMYT